jgi:hypothetical protein
MPDPNASSTPKLHLACKQGKHSYFIHQGLPRQAPSSVSATPAAPSSGAPATTSWSPPFGSAAWATTNSRGTSCWPRPWRAPGLRCRCCLGLPPRLPLLWRCYLNASHPSQVHFAKGPVLNGWRTKQAQAAEAQLGLCDQIILGPPQLAQLPCVSNGCGDIV